MKRYLVFAGDKFYAGGGMRDFQWDTDHLHEAQRLVSDDAASFNDNDWYQIYDTEERKFVLDGGGHV
jgi:hypothetical protein